MNSDPNLKSTAQPFKVGDRVRVLPGRYLAGLRGTIDRVDPHDTVRVVFCDGYVVWYSIAQVERVESLEPKAPEQAFKVGDRVCYKPDSFRVELGYVRQISPSRETANVEFDTGLFLWCGNALLERIEPRKLDSLAPGRRAVGLTEAQVDALDEMLRAWVVKSITVPADVFAGVRSELGKLVHDAIDPKPTPDTLELQATVRTLEEQLAESRKRNDELVDALTDARREAQTFREALDRAGLEYGALRVWSDKRESALRQINSEASAMLERAAQAALDALAEAQS